MAIETAAGDKRMVILVIEDDPLIRITVVDFIEKAGFEALDAANADIAMEMLERRSDIRAVFTDINMPGSIDGLKLAQAVRHQWPPIQIITSAIPQIAKEEIPHGSYFFSETAQS